MVHGVSHIYAGLMLYLDAVQEGYSARGRLFNPFSDETRAEHRLMFSYYDVDTGKAYNPVTKVSAPGQHAANHVSLHADHQKYNTAYMHCIKANNCE